MTPGTVTAVPGAGGLTYTKASPMSLYGFDTTGSSRKPRRGENPTLRDDCRCDGYDNQESRDFDALRRALSGRALSESDFERLVAFVRRECPETDDREAREIARILPRFQSLGFPLDSEDCGELFSTARYVARRGDRPQRGVRAAAPADPPTSRDTLNEMRSLLESAFISPRSALAECSEFEAGLVCKMALIGIRVTIAALDRRKKD